MIGSFANDRADSQTNGPSVASRNLDSASTWTLTVWVTRQLNRWWPEQFGGRDAIESELIDVSVTRVAPFFEGTVITAFILGLSSVSPIGALLVGNALFTSGHWNGLYKTDEN